MKHGDRWVLQEIGERCYNRGLVSGRAGNLSARLQPGAGKPEVLVTASGSCLGRLLPGQIVEVVVNEALDPIPGPGAHWGQHRPTSELPLHLAVYTAFPGLNAIVHTHSPAATAFACLGRELPLPTRESQALLRRVPVVAFHPEGSKELGRETVKVLGELEAAAAGGAALLEGHGVVCWSPGIWEALYLAELVEHTARIAVYQQLLREELAAGEVVQDDQNT